MKWLEAPDFVESVNLTCTMLIKLEDIYTSYFLFSFKIYKVKHVIGRVKRIKKMGIFQKKKKRIERMGQKEKELAMDRFYI